MKATCSLAALKDKAAGGDREAGVALHDELESQLERMVRRALRVGKPDNLISRHALAEAKSVMSDPHQPRFDSPDHLVRLVAGRMLSRVLENVSSAYGGTPC
jgi:hypothetical protein